MSFHNAGNGGCVFEIDRTTHFDSRLDVFTVLAVFRPCSSVSLYNWRLYYPWLAMAIVKAVVSIYRTGEEKLIER